MCWMCLTVSVSVCACVCVGCAGAQVAGLVEWRERVRSLLDDLADVVEAPAQLAASRLDAVSGPLVEHAQLASEAMGAATARTQRRADGAIQLAHCRVGGRLAVVDPALRKLPLPHAVAALPDEDLPADIEDKGTSTWAILGIRGHLHAACARSATEDRRECTKETSRTKQTGGRAVHRANRA